MFLLWLPQYAATIPLTVLNYLPRFALFLELSTFEDENTMFLRNVGKR